MIVPYASFTRSVSIDVGCINIFAVADVFHSDNDPIKKSSALVFV
jgi:hypothetical protein